MYKNKKLEVFHSILELKGGNPISIRLENGSLVLLCSSEHANDYTLELMRKISSSSLSILINKERMEYISSSAMKEQLYSISFSENFDSDKCQNLSCSVIIDKETLLKGSTISLEKNKTVLNLLELMKINHIIPSIVMCYTKSSNQNIYNKTIVDTGIMTLDYVEFFNPLINEKNLEILSRISLPILMCKETEVVSFRSKYDSSDLFAIILKEGDKQKCPKVRIHSQCITGDLLDSLKCDCGSQLKSAIKMLSLSGGILLYMPQEGRNIGLLNKLRAYELQTHGLDTIDANLALGFDSDQRNYVFAAEMLRLLSVGEVELITNNPDKGTQLKKGGIIVSETIQLKVDVFDEAKVYLETKKRRSGHNL